MTLARISNPLTVQFAEIFYEKRTGQDLKKGYNWLNLKTYFTILRQKKQPWHIARLSKTQKRKTNDLGLNLCQTQSHTCGNNAIRPNKYKKDSMGNSP